MAGATAEIKQYPRDKELSWVVDILLKKEEDLRAAGDTVNAETISEARELVLLVTIGLPVAGMEGVQR